MTFSEVGWDFSWGEDTEYPAPISYNTQLLMQKIYEQTQEYEIGGVPCEPDSIFVICNNYPMNALSLHDVIHKTNFSNGAVPAWRKTILENGKNRFPDIEKNDNNYFNLDYLIHPVGIWEPIGTSSGYYIIYSEYELCLKKLYVYIRVDWVRCVGAELDAWVVEPRAWRRYAMWGIL